MLESSQGADWLQSFFLIPGRTKAPRGADDPAIRGVDLEKIGRTNIEEASFPSSELASTIKELTILLTSQFVAYFMFNTELKRIKPKSIERGTSMYLPYSILLDLIIIPFSDSRNAFNDPTPRGDSHSLPFF